MTPDVSAFTSSPTGPPCFKVQNDVSRFRAGRKPRRQEKALLGPGHPIARFLQFIAGLWGVIMVQYQPA
jgi:hypothetical protein